MALALKSGGKPSSLTAPSARASRAKVYVLLGDGEINAGVIWEGAMAAAKFRLGNLTAILDYNGIQQTGATADVMPTEPIADKWESFGWQVQEVHGHNLGEVLNALDRADEVHARPSMIIARTIKGKGVSFMEYDHRWHGLAPNPSQYEMALAELEEGSLLRGTPGGGAAGPRHRDPESVPVHGLLRRRELRAHLRTRRRDPAQPGRGAHLALRARRPQAGLFSVAAVDGRAIVVGEKGPVRVSTNGGEAWGPPDPGSLPEIFTFMRDLGFEHNRRVGFIVGQQGMVLRSQDGGRSWTSVLPPDGAAEGVERLL